MRREVQRDGLFTIQPVTTGRPRGPASFGRPRTALGFTPIGNLDRFTGTAKDLRPTGTLGAIMSRNSSVVRSVLVAALFSRALATPTRAGDPDAKALQMLVDRLADSGNGFDTPEAVAASRILDKFGTKAFPVLIENLDDQRPACRCFQQDTSTPTTVGAACMGIMRGQVEKYTYLGKAFPRYLHGKDLKSWWQENNQKDLLQLQVEAIEWSIKEIETNESYKRLQSHLPKLSKSLKELQAQQTLEKQLGGP